MENPVRYECRNKVLWLGEKVPDQLAADFARLGLDFSLASATVAKQDDQRLRAVLVHYTESTAGSLRPQLDAVLPVLEGGALVAAVAEQGQSFATALSIVNRVRLKLQQDKGEPVPESVLPVFSPSDVFRGCVHHDPGPPANNALVIEGDLGSLTDEEKFLLRRAFYSTTNNRMFSKLVLHKESGGRSVGTKVWRVNAHLEDGRWCEPFVVKAGRPGAIREEFATTKNYVVDFVPFPFRPPISEDRMIVGTTRAMLVSMFVSRAQRFDHYVLAVKAPQLAVSALFDGPLRNWRASAQLSKSDCLGRVYVEHQKRFNDTIDEDERIGRPNTAVLPDPDRLVAVWERAKEIDSAVPDPTALWRMLSSLPPFGYYECHGHGDLSARNLFVRWNGLDVILIDFSHSGGSLPMSRDPARFEVSLAFDVGEAQKLLDDKILSELYTRPLLPLKSAYREDGRLEAIRQIRLHVAGEGITNKEYEISIACHLLRHARIPREGVSTVTQEAWRIRVFAYISAARLIANCR